MSPVPDEELTVREALVKLCEGVRAHDARSEKAQEKIYETEVGILTHQNEIARLQAITQQQVTDVVKAVETLTEAVTKYSEMVKQLVETNAQLTKQQADLLKWLTTEVSRNSKMQSALIWKILAAVLAAFSTLLTAYIATKGSVP